MACFLWTVYCVLQYYILAETFDTKEQTGLQFTTSVAADKCFLLFAGNNVLNSNVTIAQRSWGNLVKLLVTALIKLFSFIRLFISGAERRLDTGHHSPPPVPAGEEPQPPTVSDDEMRDCLHRLDNLESLCNHLTTKPPQIPEDKELMLLNSFERIKSIEADLERTKRVSSYRELIYFVREILDMHAQQSSHCHVIEIPIF
jgi:hypothetical protein